MHYPDSVSFLYALGNEIRTVKFGLEAITTVLRHLGNPQDSYRVVHVAGTNGKGSTCAMIESALRASGVRTGLFTSPHLVEPTERIVIGGAQVTHAQFADAFLKVHQANEELLAAGELEYHTTYFETVTAMGLLLFAEAGVKIAVLETGMGGRLDATNAVQQPELCVITPVDFDHEAFLGNSIEAIAGEKAGILKAGVPAVFARQRPEAEAVLTSRAEALEIPVRATSEYESQDLQVHARGSSFNAVRKGSSVHVRCPLAGPHQADNAMTAVAALQMLGVAAEDIEAGIAATRWPARLQTIGEAPEILLDGAHNPAGARALAEHLRRFYAGRNIRLIYGAMRDKSVEEITEILFPLATEIVLTAPDAARAVRPEALLEAAGHPRARIAETAAEALAEARATPAGDVAVITGSLYLAGEILALLQ